MKGGEGPAYLVTNNFCPRFNVVFDIDHTLIFAFQVGTFSKIDEKKEKSESDAMLEVILHYLVP